MFPETVFFNFPPGYVTCRVGRRFTIFCFLLTIFLSTLCFPMSAQSVSDCFFCTCCMNTPTYVHNFLAEFLTLRTSPKKKKQWLPVGASLKYGQFGCIGRIVPERFPFLPRARCRQRNATCPASKFRCCASHAVVQVIARDGSSPG